MSCWHEVKNQTLPRQCPSKVAASPSRFKGSSCDGFACVVQDIANLPLLRLADVIKPGGGQRAEWPSSLTLCAHRPTHQAILQQGDNFPICRLRSRFQALSAGSNAKVRLGATFPSRKEAVMPDDLGPCQTCPRATGVLMAARSSLATSKPSGS